MRERFREYHQFSDKGIKELWSKALFVFDTNTLLNMYRYSRDTVDDYVKVLSELKKEDRIWIPYQVGLEFYENRMSVISEYERSYDSILQILEKTKEEIENKYKNHPFLNLSKIREDISLGLSNVERDIKTAKDCHPKWLKKDDMLEKINGLFENATGDPYPKDKLTALYRQADKRYESKIPPGYKDANKEGVRKYGDYILWCQIIDKAKEAKKPVVFISGDVKEDWWLENNGEKIQPRPELKREMLDEADVDFHIYTADRFLELYKSGKGKVEDKTIREVKEIRELEEKMARFKHYPDRARETRFYDNIEIHHLDFLRAYEYIEKIVHHLRPTEISTSSQKELEYIYRKLRDVRDSMLHGQAMALPIEMYIHRIKEAIMLIERLTIIENLSDLHMGECKITLNKLNLILNELYERKS